MSNRTFEGDFNSVFGGIESEARPYSAQELYEIDYNKGMKDAESGIRFVDQGLAYTEGYFFGKASMTAKEAMR